MGERLLCKQEVIGSIPFTSTTLRAYALRVARHPKALERRRALRSLSVGGRTTEANTGHWNERVSGSPPWCDRLRRRRRRRGLFDIVKRLCLVSAPAPFAASAARVRVTCVFVESCASGLSLRMAICNQALKGIWWMPWHQEAMKDVARCDKPRGVASKL